MLERLEQIARRAGEGILARPEFETHEKTGHANFVTTIDEQTQRFLEEETHKLLPEARIIGEEKENSDLTEEYTWVIDPVDGTTNLIHDYRQSAISIALLRDKRPVLGLIYQPYSREMFTAELGKGAYLNGKPIHVAQNDAAHALVAFGTSPYNAELAERGIALAYRYLRTCTDIRRTGSAAIDLTNLACGRTDAYFELRLSPWDFAAGALIVSEAGGVFTMPLSPTGLDFSRPQAVLAATPACFDAVYGIFEEEAAKWN